MLLVYQYGGRGRGGDGVMSVKKTRSNSISESDFFLIFPAFERFHGPSSMCLRTDTKIIQGQGIIQRNQH